VSRIDRVVQGALGALDFRGVPTRRSSIVRASKGIEIIVDILLGRSLHLRVLLGLLSRFDKGHSSDS